MHADPIKDCRYQKIFPGTRDLCNLLKLILIRNLVLTIVKILVTGMPGNWSYLIISVFILLV